MRLHLIDRLDRDVRRVHDVRLPSEYRIVRFEEHGGARRPFVPSETVRIEVELEVPAAEEPGPATSDRGGSGV